MNSLRTVCNVYEYVVYATQKIACDLKSFAFVHDPKSMCIPVIELVQVGCCFGDYYHGALCAADLFLLVFVFVDFVLPSN